MRVTSVRVKSVRVKSVRVKSLRQIFGEKSQGARVKSECGESVRCIILSHTKFSSANFHVLFQVLGSWCRLWNVFPMHRMLLQTRFLWFRSSRNSYSRSSSFDSKFGSKNDSFPNWNAFAYDFVTANPATSARMRNSHSIKIP